MTTQRVTCELSSGASSLSSRSSSPRISPITRLRHARQVHEQLQERKWTDRCSSKASIAEPKTASRVVPHPNRSDHRQHLHRHEAASIDALAQDLQQSEQDNRSSDSLINRVEKIGANEKNALVVHLLQRTALLEAQRNDVIAVGEKLTTQLVQQQHELRVRFRAQMTQLQEQLYEALNNHPEVARLEEQIVQLQNANRESDQKLLFAAQKLHRSRQRERALRLEHESDPLLWDL